MNKGDTHTRTPDTNNREGDIGNTFEYYVELTYINRHFVRNIYIHYRGLAIHVRKLNSDERTALALTGESSLTGYIPK